MDPRVLVCAQRGQGHILQQTGPFFSCGPRCSKASRSLYAKGGRSHILQQNRAVLFVWLL